jgi:putative transposase
MAILAQIVKRMKLRKCQAIFLEQVIGVILAIPGRINYLNLERYSNRSEKSYRTWFEKPLDWLSINSEIVVEMQTRGLMGKTLVMAVDGSFINKAGKHTPELGKFWNSKQGKAIQGLEVHSAALIDLEKRQAFVMEAKQTPATPLAGDSRIVQYAKHSLEVITALPPCLRQQLKCVVADALYAKAAFVNTLRAEGIHVVSKFRVDANLKYLYLGERTNKPGRPKRFDGKVDFKDFSRWQVVQSDKTSITYTAILYSVALKCEVRVVVISYVETAQTKAHHEVLFATDLMMSALDIIACYRARFELEFVFRDAKQFTGLQDCQSRSLDALDFHWNASFLGVNVTRAQQLSACPCADYLQDSFVFSMEDEKRRAFNLLLAQTIIETLPGHLTFQYCLPFIQTALNLGVKAT